MLKQTLFVLALAFAGCSATPPASRESPRSAPDIAALPPNLPITPAVAIPPPDPREAVLSATVLKLLQEDHLLHKKIDDGISRTAFATYMDRLDSGKLFLLRSDRDSLARFADKIDDELNSGSLDLAHEGEKLFVARVAVVDKLVASLLAAPFDHTKEEWLETDPKKVQPAATEQELSDRWRQHLELEVLERVDGMETRLAGDKTKPGKPSKDAKKPSDDDDATLPPAAQIPATPELREAKARADLAKSYAARFARLSHPGALDAASAVINAVTSALDPHTDYLPPADKANFDIAISGSLEGIGAVLREHDEYIEIVELVPGGASARQGSLAPGDLILSVQAEHKDPVDVADMNINDVVKMIRGPKGTVVRLRIQKPTGNQETVAITRDVVVVEEAYARGAIVSHKGQPSFGYIHLPSFYGGNGTGQRTSADDMRKLLAEMATRKVAGVVIDIRSNGGGLLGDSIEMTGELIDQGPVVQVRDNRNHREVLNDDQAGETYDGPVIVLVDRFSASASEIFAGALQDYQRAIIVGTGPTHGKGTVQTLADLDRATNGKIELGVLKMTIQQFFRPSGSSTQMAGVTPDILLPDPAGYIDAGEKQLEHALPWSQIEPAPHAMWHATWKPAALIKLSAARVAKQPELTKIATTTQVLRALREDTRVPLAKTAWDARRKKLKAAVDAASPDPKTMPALFTVKQLDDANAPPPTMGADGKPDDRVAKWRDSLARDPWVDECVSILGDMAK